MCIMHCRNCFVPSKLKCKPPSRLAKRLEMGWPAWRNLLYDFTNIKPFFLQNSSSLLLTFMHAPFVSSKSTSLGKIEEKTTVALPAADLHARNKNFISLHDLLYTSVTDIIRTYVQDYVVISVQL